MNKTFFIFLMVFCTAFSALAQSNISGKVVSAESDEPLIGANVFVVGTKFGARTNAKGEYSISDLKPGNYTLKVTYIGFKPSEKKINVKANEEITHNFELEEGALESQAIQVVGSRAQYRETPVAFSDISKQQIVEELASRDLPMLLNNTPGVYATEQGGGSGDSRINIRGFNQRNVSVMINGVPVNDMENGWVYWSNWDGLGDATSSLQVQRGLGASRMANPSVGGTMNIVTDAANQKPGISLKQEFGIGNFLKSTVIGNTGKIGDFAATVTAVRKTGDGVVKNVWTDAWAYYFSVSYDLNENHSFDFYLTGAPQEHGQRSFRQPIANFDKDLARSSGVVDSVINFYTEFGYDYNPNWGVIKIDPKYPIQQYYDGKIQDFRQEGLLMAAENYYHKPQGNLNWNWRMAPQTNLTSVFYFSRGIGGGSGTVGQIPQIYNKTREDNGQMDFQQLYDFNTSDQAIDPRYSKTLHKAKSILRNSVNQHYWYGYLGTLETKSMERFSLHTGLDLRYYQGEHWQEVRNLLGADYYFDTSDKTQTDTLSWMKKLGDKINYNNDGIVSWIGGFAQGEYKFEKVTSYVNLSLSNTGYKRVDYFRTDSMPNGRETEWENFLGYTIKVGANYNIDENFNVFGNLGHYVRPPLYQNVFYNDNSVYDNVLTEKVNAIELGVGYNTRDLRINLNAYWTQWRDRAWYTSSYVTNTDGSRTYFNYNLPGLGADHKGVELDFNYRLFRWMRINGMISIGDWRWVNDVFATYSPENVVDANGNPITFTRNLYIKDIKVSDAAQTTASLSVYFYPIKKTSIIFTYNYFTNYYADFNPELRNNRNDRAQPWQIPAYGMLNAKIYSTLPLNLPVDIRVFASGLNILNAKFITDARDGADHTANTAQVYVGLPFRWNFGVQFTY